MIATITKEVTRDPQFYKLRRAKRLARKKERRILKSKFSKAERKMFSNARKTKAQRRFINRKNRVEKQEKEVVRAEKRLLDDPLWFECLYSNKVKQLADEFVEDEVKLMRKQEERFLDKDEDNDTIRAKFWASPTGIACKLRINNNKNR